MADSATAMTLAMWWIGAIAVAVVAGWMLVRRKLGHLHEAWLPEELRGARIVYAERYFSTKRPIRLVAKIDRAYRRGSGALVLVELKRRVQTQAYWSDVVELSAQKVAIERGARRTVAPRGFVVVEHPITRKRTAIAVELIGESDVVALAELHSQLVDGSATPKKANVAGLCRACPHAARCKPQALRHSVESKHVVAAQ